MAGPWRLRFTEWEAFDAFGNPYDAATRLAAQQALGYVPWPFVGYGDAAHAGVLA